MKEPWEEKWYNGKCYSCRFYESQECRRHAPVLIDCGEYINWQGHWPRKEWTDWCGDYERKPTPEAETK